MANAKQTCSSHSKSIIKTIEDDKRQLVYSMCVCDSSRVTRRRIAYLEGQVETLTKNISCLQEVLKSDLTAVKDLEEEVIRFKKIREEYDGEVEEISQKLDEWESIEREVLPKVMMTAVEKTLNVLFDTEHKVTVKTLLQRMSANDDFKEMVKKATGETLKEWKKDVVARIMESAEEELLKAFNDVKV